MDIPIERIRPSPYQPRLAFDIEDLKEEIKRDGLLSPLIVRETNGYYELIDGERRLRALKELDWKKVPVEIRRVDDKTARLSVYKLNMVRLEYSVEERARYFKKLSDEGYSLSQIGNELSLDKNWIQAHLDIFKFPNDIQNVVWTGQLSVAHIRELQTIIGESIDEATGIIKEIMLRRLSRDETRRLIQPRLETIQQTRIKAAQESLTRTSVPEMKLDTPEDLEKTAFALRKEANRRRIQELTPEQRDELDTERRRKLEARRIEAEQLRRNQIAEQKQREEEIKRRVDEEANRRALEIAETERKQREMETLRRIEEEAKSRVTKITEADRQRIEEEAQRKAKEEILSNPLLIQKLVKEAQVNNPEQFTHTELQQTLESLMNEPENRFTEERNKVKEYERIELPEEPLPMQIHHKLMWNLERMDEKYDFYTMGYSQVPDVNSLIEKLKSVGIRTLIDIRHDPISQYRPEFSKDNLARALKAVGISYVSYPELGVPREERTKVSRPEDFGKLWEWYDRNVIPKLDNILKTEKLIDHDRQYAFMCVELDPTKCHRHRLALSLEKRGLKGWEL